MNNVPQTAFILAAGLGTRMRPLTLDRPKALVEVAGSALIDHVMDRLSAAGVKRFVVNVHAFADRLEAHLLARTDLDIVISNERETLLETGGGLKKARSLLGNDAIWVANIDSIWLEPEGRDEDSLHKLAKLWNPQIMDAALMVSAREGSIGFEGDGDFFLNADKSLRFRAEAANAPYAFMGVHITMPGIADHIEEEAFSLSKIWRASALNNRLFGTVFTGQWMHVGDPEAVKQANAQIMKSQMPKI